MNFNSLWQGSKKRILSIDFGQAFLKIAILSASEQGLKLSAYSVKEIVLTEVTRKDVVGFIEDFVKTNEFQEKEVHLTFSDPDAFFVKILTLPQMPREELFSAIPWQIKSEIPFLSAESVFEFYVIREYADEERNKKMDVLSVFAKNSSLDKYISLVRQCGLVPVKITSSPFDYAALLRSVKPEIPVVAVLDVGSQYSYLALYKESALVYVRKLSFSSLKLAESLVGTLVTETGRLEISFERAREILRDMGIPLSETADVVKDIPRQHVLSLMRPILENLIKDVERSFDYLSSSLGIGAPEVFYMTGGGSKVKNFEVYLNQELKIPVRFFPIFKLFQVALLDQDKFLKDQNQLASVLGAALPSAFNFLPSELRVHPYEFVQKLSLRLIAVILGVFFIFSFIFLNFEAHRVNKKIRFASVQLEDLGMVRMLKQKIDAKTALRSKALEGKVPCSGLLKLISALVPDSVLLDELIFIAKDHSVLLRGVIAQQGDSKESILVDFINKCEASQFITQATLVTSKLENGVSRFEIRCDVAR